MIFENEKNNTSEFVKWFGPLLDALRDLGYSGKPKEVSDTIAKKLDVPDYILDQTLKSGANRFHNQVAWAKDAQNEANRDGAPPIELIDGQKLVEMFEMVQLGVKPKTIFEIDMTYFEKFKS